MNNQHLLKIKKILDEIETVIVGKRDIAILSLTAFFASGHILIEDVPGVGKTMLVRTLAKVMGTTFKRIQFTPDLLPADVTGVSIFNPDTRQFEFRKGPIMGNIILADEINRTSPRTQAALLEGMAENSVTVDGISYPLAEPFFVMATQNPIEYQGTYSLPEAQLDRFLLKTTMGYPTFQEEVALLAAKQTSDPLCNVQTVITPTELIALKKATQQVVVSSELATYIIRLVQATRNHPLNLLGVSPRGSLAMLNAAKSYAFISGRQYVLPDDIQYLAPFVFAHRLILNQEAIYDETTAQNIIEEILQSTVVPIGKG